ncbi:MAG: hypothetical protein ABXS92_05870 [Sulfurimonas sp.]
MKKLKYSAVAALAMVAALNASEDLGVITVESSTIDDKFQAKKPKLPVWQKSAVRKSMHHILKIFSRFCS